MTNTELLHFIRQELIAQEISWKSEKELFEMLVPDEDWDKYKTNWSNWKQRKDKTFRVDYLQRAPNILTAIQTKLSFDTSIWDAGDLTQQVAVQRGIQLAFKIKRNPIDFGALLPKHILKNDQKELLEIWEHCSITVIEAQIKQYEEWFERTMINQPFLLELLNLLYLKGAYQLLVNHVFLKLLSTKRSQPEVKIVEANVLNALPQPKYLQAVELLNSIEGKDSLDVIDLKTSVVSSLRRYHICHGNLEKKEFKAGVSTIMETYYQLYNYDKIYHYYPALHFLYALILAEALGLETVEIDKQKFYKSVQPSIKNDKVRKEEDNYYYASMSDFELRLLLGEDVLHEMGGFLELYEPSISLLYRTKRQMVEYVELIERYTIDLPEKVCIFRKVILLFEDYEKQVRIILK